MIGIYVHIPFCLSKCGYCDFHSIIADDSFVGNYVDALNREITLVARSFQSKTFATLYIGGGTPTCLGEQNLIKLINQLKANFNFTPNFEFSVEANPGTLNRSKVAVLADKGVNRISLGAQAFQNNLLKAIGRNHTVEQIFSGVELLQEEGIDNINLDLIYGLPRQTLVDWEESLKYAISLKPKHLSCYSLIIEENTPFYQLYNESKLALPNEEIEYAMFEANRRLLEPMNFQHYEISNFAIPGFEAKHNLIYWHNQFYLGLGSGAHGYFNNIRYYNDFDLNQYILSLREDTFPVAFQETISNDTAMDETMILGLRLLKGVKHSDFETRFGSPIYGAYGRQIKKLIERGLLKDKNGYLSLTKPGLSLGNQVFSSFIRTKPNKSALDKQMTK